MKKRADHEKDLAGAYTQLDGEFEVARLKRRVEEYEKANSTYKNEARGYRADNATLRARVAELEAGKGNAAWEELEEASRQELAALRGLVVQCERHGFQWTCLATAREVLNQTVNHSAQNPHPEGERDE